MAAFLTLKTFCHERKNIHIRLKVDNTTSVAYINKKGGRKKDLNDLAREIWTWALENFGYQPSISQENLMCSQIGLLERYMVEKLNGCWTPNFQIH